MAFTLQLKRHVNYESKSAALAGLKAYLATAAVGEPAIATYGGGETIDPEKVLFGIKGAEDYTIFDYEAIPADVQAALDAIKGEGYDEDGTYATLKAIADALTIINGAETVEGSIAKAEKDAKDYADEKVAALDFTDSAVAGQFVDSVSETDGVVSVTRKPITSNDKSVVLSTANGVDLSVNIDGTTILRDGETGVLSVASAALVQYVGADAIKVSEVKDGNKTISLAISPNDKVLSQNGDGLLATFSVAKLASATEGYAASYQLQDKEGNAMGVTIDIPKDMVIANAEVKEVETADQPYSGAAVGDKYIDFTIANASSDHIYLPAKDMFDAYVQGNGIEIVGNKITAKIDAATEAFLTVGADGIKLSGVQDAIDAAKAESQAAIDKVEASVGLAANGSHTTTSGNYTSGATTVVGEIAALDAALKVANDALAAETTAREDADEALQTELDAVEAAVGLGENGAFVAPTGSNYTDAATSVMDAISKLDAQAKANADAIAATEAAAISVVAGNGISVTGEGTEKTITAVAKASDPVIEVTAEGIGVKGNAVIDCGQF